MAVLCHSGMPEHSEPLPDDSVLRTVPGITIYSHMAGQTAEARDAAGWNGAQELVRALEGRPESLVNADLLRHPRIALENHPPR